MDDRSSLPFAFAAVKKSIWTKFGSEKANGANTPEGVPLRQTDIQSYWNPKATHGIARNALGRTRPERSPSQASAFATVSSGSPLDTGRTTTPKLENQGSLPDASEISKRIVDSMGRMSTGRSGTNTPAPSTSTPKSAGRGRPKGWKPGMSYAAMRGGNTPPRWRVARTPRQPRAKAPQPGFGRRPGRPPRPRSPPPKELYYKANPHFVNFLCEWHGCRAELHNLDTLRRHIRIVHQQRGEWSCHWAHCTLGRFRDAQQWRLHLEDAHLSAFQWHVGDGPNNTGGMRIHRPDSSQDDIPDFLMGSNGQQVTPSIKDQKLEDFATWKENRRKLKELLIHRDENLPDESSESSEEKD